MLLLKFNFTFFENTLNFERHMCVLYTFYYDQEKIYLFYCDDDEYIYR